MDGGGTGSFLVNAEQVDPGLGEGILVVFKSGFRDYMGQAPTNRFFMEVFLEKTGQKQWLYPGPFEA